MSPDELIAWIASQPPTKEWVCAIVDYILEAPDWALIDVGCNPGRTAFFAVFGHMPTRQEVRMEFTALGTPVLPKLPLVPAGSHLH